ncbi:hypothetical protein K523DRAFT_218645, partial [Schizophyllum commune Tattone D]
SFPPPRAICSDPSCRNTALGEESCVQARVYTLRSGAHTAHSFSSYCRGCSTRYYHNYRVQRASQQGAVRLYYPSSTPPRYIHVQEQTYVERDLVLYFEQEMAFQHASAAALAQVYNATLNQAGVRMRSRLQVDITADIIYDAFFIHALLRDCALRDEQLSLPHHGPHHRRLDEALLARNTRMWGTGQKQWAHTCKVCTELSYDSQGRPRMFRAVVSDGVTCGYPCCSVDKCRVVLDSPKDLYCHLHAYLTEICFMRGCSAPRLPDGRSCANPDHIARRKGMAIEGSSSQRQADGAQVKDRLGDLLSDRRRKAPAILRRHWTHGDQLQMYTCGVIISRVPLYHTESVHGAVSAWMLTWPPRHRKALPSVIFYDKNCQVLEHLRAQGSTYFDLTGLPVDVFHYSHKHSEDDTFCRDHCNPANFPGLLVAGKWRFNSSKAEQNNVWYGGFQAITNEMSAYRYNFYMDEMVALYNEHIVDILERQGAEPMFLPSELL